MFNVVSCTHLFPPTTTLRDCKLSKSSASFLFAENWLKFDADCVAHAAARVQCIFLILKAKDYVPAVYRKLNEIESFLQVNFPSKCVCVRALEIIHVINIVLP